MGTHGLNILIKQAFQFKGVEPGKHTLPAHVLGGQPSNEQEALANTRTATAVIEVTADGPRTVELTLR